MNSPVPRESRAEPGGRSSIRRRLLTGLVVTVLSVWSAATLFVYLSARHEVEEVYDAALSRQAAVLATLVAHEAEEEMQQVDHFRQLRDELGEDVLQRSPLFNELAERYLGGKQKSDYLKLAALDPQFTHPYESTIAFQINAADQVILRSPNAPSFDTDSTGFSELLDGGERWRSFGVPIPGRGLQIHVGEKMSLRGEIVKFILLSALWPIFVCLPLLALMVWFIVTKGLSPLHRVARSVEARDPGSMEPISIDGVPAEVVPMIRALNDLFERVHQALENERRFTANAAHELRTPLAALKTQAQAAQIDLAPDDAHAGFMDRIISGVDRATHLLEQLLALARVDAAGVDIMRQAADIDLRELAGEVIAECFADASARDITLSYAGERRAYSVRGDRAGLTMLLRNLVDNAVRYTPPGGAVDVALEKTPSGVRLTVADSGPGIPAEQRERVFRRFQRGEDHTVPGSGLGLSIVCQVAQLHHADIGMHSGSGGRGLVVSVTFPGEA